MAASNPNSPKKKGKKRRPKRHEPPPHQTPPSEQKREDKTHRKSSTQEDFYFGSAGGHVTLSENDASWPNTPATQQEKKAPLKENNPPTSKAAPQSSTHTKPDTPTNNKENKKKPHKQHTIPTQPHTAPPQDAPSAAVLDEISAKTTSDAPLGETNTAEHSPATPSAKQNTAALEDALADTTEDEIKIKASDWRELQESLQQLAQNLDRSDVSSSTMLLARLRRQIQVQAGGQSHTSPTPPSETEREHFPPTPSSNSNFDSFGRSKEAIQKALPLLRFLYQRYFRIQCEGLENIPRTGRVILVANHSGALPYDALMLMTALEHSQTYIRPLRPLIEDLFYHAPFLGPTLYKLGCVRACQENATQLLEQDKAIVVFPEGYQGLSKPFSQRYKLQRFGRGGFVKLALRTSAPIIPVAVVGAEEIHPIVTQLSQFTKALGIPYFPITPTFPLLGPLGLLPLPSPWKIKIGEPIQLPYTAADCNDPLLINRQVEEIRAKVQQMVTGMVSQRRWPFSGKPPS